MITLGPVQSLAASAAAANVVNCFLEADTITPGATPPDLFSGRGPLLLGTTPLVLAAAAAGQQILVKSIALYSAATAPVTVAFYSNGTAAPNQRFGLTLPAGGSAAYEDGRGWVVYDANGMAMSSLVPLDAPLPVNQGGTGDTALAANSLLVGNGAAPVLAPAELSWDGSLLSAPGVSLGGAAPALSIQGQAAQTGAYSMVLDAAGNLLQALQPASGGDPRVQWSCYNTLEAAPANYERVSLYFDNPSNLARLETQAGGTGVARSLALQAGGGRTLIGYTYDDTTSNVQISNGTTGGTAQAVIRAFANGGSPVAALVGQAANGTPALPAAVTSGQVLMSFGGSGHNGSAFLGGNSALVQMVSTEAWSTTANGSRIQFVTTPNGSPFTSRANRVVIDHSGNTGFGPISPTARIHIGAGTAAAGTAPIKIAAGTNLTTPEAGALEYDGNQAYFTPSTAVRMAVQASKPVGAAITTASYTQLQSDTELLFSSTSGCTITLLSAAGYPGRKLWVQNLSAQVLTSASSNVIPAGNTAAGTAILPATAGAWAVLESNGVGWQVLACSSASGGGSGSTITSGTYASRPSSPSAGQVYKCTDCPAELFSTGGVSFDQTYHRDVLVSPYSDTGASWVNQSSCTIAGFGPFTYVSGPTTASDNLVLRVKPTSATPYDIKIWLKPMSVNQSNETFGLCLTDGTKIVTWGVTPRSSTSPNIFELNKWTNSTTFSSGYITSSPAPFLIDGVWLRIANDGSSYSFYWSGDGQNWRLFYTTAVSGFYLSATSIGLFMNLSAGAVVSVGPAMTIYSSTL